MNAASPKNRIRAVLAAAFLITATATRAGDWDGWHFPPPGEGPEQQDRRNPREVGLDPAVIEQLRGKATRWALWRHGHLVHVEGDFHHKQDVFSLRKTWHALAVAAAIKQGRIPSYHQKISEWEKDLTGNDATATWRHVITQSSGFDYPYDGHPDYEPGRIWTYSDKNPVRLCDALAKAFGRREYRDDYAAVLRTAYFDAIGMRGWSTGFSKEDDGVRLLLDLEDMGRLGLLVLARGTWDGKEVIPRWFIEELETKQTRGMLVNYDGPDDGAIGLDPKDFPEAPYGYMTWVNTDGDYFPGADRAWAWGTGRGGNVVFWNRDNGTVFVAHGLERVKAPVTHGIPHIIEANLTGPDPLVAAGDAGRTVRVGQYGRFEASLVNERRYDDPYRDVTLDVTYRRPDGTAVRFWGFHDGGQDWKIRTMPDRAGTWRYEATFSDGAPGASGSFECMPSDAPGMIDVHAANPIWFGRRGDGAVLLRGLHVGDRFFAANWPDARRTAFLDWAQARGYNTLSVASFLLNRDSPGRGRGWETPDLWPLDAAEYRRLETTLDDLARRRLIVYPFAGFFGQASDYPRDRADQERFLRYALARLAPYGNLLFNAAGPEPNLRKEWMAGEDVERLGRLIRRLDPFDHPLSVHNRTGVEPYRDSDWTSYGTVQGPKTLDRRELGRKLLEWHHPAKPLLAQETLWSGNINHRRRFEGGRDYSDDDLRKNAYVILMSGANFVFADNDGDSSTGFSGTLDPADCRERRHDVIRRAWDAFETFPYHRMRPRQDLVDRGYCLADAGREYLVYLESRGTVNIRTEGGPCAVEWIDARDPSERRPGGLTDDGRALTAPDLGDDWLLRLSRRTD